jgi:hypothetical protein
MSEVRILSPRPITLAASADRVRVASLLLVVALALAGCATNVAPPTGVPPPISANEGRALVSRLLPSGLVDRTGWSTDIYAALAALDIAATPANVCAAIAVAEQESGMRIDPAIPGLGRIARKELEARRERAGVPKLVLDAALALPSSNGVPYGVRLDAVRTEGQLSALYDEFIDRVPFGKSLFADRNPVRTGGPMQVGIAFAKAQIEAKPYPYRIAGSVRDEVFSRRGGVYFGIAHLLDYRAPYDRYLYRFADYNAGRYASRNAAFQRAVSDVSGIPLVQDGDLQRYDGDRPASEASDTELALRVIASRLGMSATAMRHDLERARSEAFVHSALYTRLFALADAIRRPAAPRAIVPTIVLSSPKITRRLTTEWFARRVNERFVACMRR